MENELLEINGITLLSIEEAEKIPKDIRSCRREWWLRTPSRSFDPFYSSAITFVYWSGDIDSSGESTNFIKNIRPVLIIPELEDLDLEKFKDSIEVFDREWIYIGEGMALAENPIFESIFDLNSNNYETSEIKQKLEDWLLELLSNGN